jgi:processive 1,2-diacylglycerol beta-glucosyltransferase
MSPIRLFREHPDTFEHELLGTITEDQLDFLMENVEEEFEEEEEYFLNPDTVDYLREQGADGDLLALLEKALAGTRDGVDILYVIE